MKFAEVAVNAPVKNPRTFSYSIPDGLESDVGQAVWVPFGSKTLQGIVISLSDIPRFESPKDIFGAIQEFPLLTPYQVDLACWMSSYYCSPLFASCSLMLPPGFERKVVTLVRYAGKRLAEELPGLSQDEQELVSAVNQRDEITMKELEKQFGVKNARARVQGLVRKGIISRAYILEKEKVRPRKVKFIALSGSPEETRKLIHSWEQDKRFESRIRIVELLLKAGRPLSPAEVKNGLGQKSLILEPLLKLGVVSIEEREVRRDPLAMYATAADIPPILTAYQDKAWYRLQAAIRQDRKSITAGNSSIFLLHGITGSGKTEIYLRAVAETLAVGKKAIVLVPEIALTPQTISRFIARFPGRVAVLHSRLSIGEQYDEWWRIKAGECDVVIGSRSAIFSPQPDLGLIVIDEEHEWTYKQKESHPLYHARDVALKLAGLVGATVVLGSATPDVCSYYLSRRGDYTLLELPERVSSEGHAALPQVEVVDMRRELVEGNRSIFSRSLRYGIQDVLKEGEQVILFLNRRGSSTFIQCRDCGVVLRCRRCEVSLVYHGAEDMLLCHQCNYRMRVPEECPNCSSRRIKYLGTGTQRVEEEAKAAFGGVRLLRWDRDTTKGKHSHETIFNKLVTREADILIGTQMVAKGLDIPTVTLVGVINADVGLFLPDFRAAERAFQIMTQVAGRAGRGVKPGKVIIQTYSPLHYAVLAASRQDYKGFYEKELTYRSEFNYPPYTRLACLSYSHTNQVACREEAERVAGLIKQIISEGVPGVDILGPTPAFVGRRSGRYRWQNIIRGEDIQSLLQRISLPTGWSIDVDPVGIA